MKIALSILEYEPELMKNCDYLKVSGAMSKILNIIQTRKIVQVHIDVMSPPMIPCRITFPIKLIKSLYEELHDKIPLAVHLMVNKPILIIEKMNEFISRDYRHKIGLIIQIEAFNLEDTIIKALKYIKNNGYLAGICLNLPTPQSCLTKKVICTSDIVLLMTVPMGRGGQKYNDKATSRIIYFSRILPKATIWVDGGINPKTLLLAKKAGAKIAVVGSYITKKEKPLNAIDELELSLA